MEVDLDVVLAPIPSNAVVAGASTRGARMEEVRSKIDVPAQVALPAFAYSDEVV